jgi:CO/xanthine dehydrogenase Mo-binding subunit
MVTANQGGASASSGIRAGAIPLRNAAAEARRLLAVAGAQRLGVAADAVSTANGTVFVTAEPGRRIAYGDILEGKGFGASLNWNREMGTPLNVTGSAKPKSVAEYKVVGQPVARRDIPAKMLGTTDYLTNVRVPGMLHARVIRPPVAAAVAQSFDASSIAGIAGARVVHKQDFLAVVAEREWDAVRAARALKVTWTSPEMNWPGHDGVHDHIRSAPAVASNGESAFAGKRVYDETPTYKALASAARVITADYEAPFQSHARMAPSVGVADVKADSAVIYADTQKPHFLRLGISKLLGMQPDQVRVIWKTGAGSYGRSDSDEAPYEAAVLSRELGRPVRVQWSREEGIAWDPKAPAGVMSMKAGLNDKGGIEAWYFRAKGFSGWDVKFTADSPEQTLVGMQLGHAKWNMHNYDVPTESYQFPNTVRFWQTIAPLQVKASPMRTAHLRAPQEVQTRFAQECFVDEVAMATGRDPLTLRLAACKDPREIDVLKAVTEKAGWNAADTRPRAGKGDVVTGRGLALYNGYGSYAALVVEVEVNRKTGRVFARKVTVAQDSGLIINPQSIRTVIEGNVVQGLSRALCEEVAFDSKSVTSVDWLTYPIIDVKDVPEQVDTVIINRTDKASGGAGEPTLVSIAAAVGNAIHNATGVRIRRYPFTAARVREALSA